MKPEVKFASGEINDNAKDTLRITLEGEGLSEHWDRITIEELDMISDSLVLIKNAVRTRINYESSCTNKRGCDLLGTTLN